MDSLLNNSYVFLNQKTKIRFNLVSKFIFWSFSKCKKSVIQNWKLCQVQDLNFWFLSLSASSDGLPCSANWNVDSHIWKIIEELVVPYQDRFEFYRSVKKPVFVDNFHNHALKITLESFYSHKYMVTYFPGTSDFIDPLLGHLM